MRGMYHSTSDCPSALSPAAHGPDCSARDNAHNIIVHLDVRADITHTHDIVESRDAPLQVQLISSWPSSSGSGSATGVAGTLGEARWPGGSSGALERPPPRRAEKDLIVNNSSI